MKTKLFFALLMVFALSAPATFGANSKSVTTDKKENKLSEEEVTRLTKRVEEIRDMDKTNMTKIEKRELRKELKATKENVRKDGGYVYIGAGTLILIIILIILLV
jgi:N-acetylmuramic acid 6-phosphate (MurNAc-6-P) etherase